MLAELQTTLERGLDLDALCVFYHNDDADDEDEDDSSSDSDSDSSDEDSDRSNGGERLGFRSSVRV